MRLPAVPIAAAFTCGIALGLHPVVARNASSHILLPFVFIVIGFLVLIGMIFVRIERVFLASVASMRGVGAVHFEATERCPQRVRPRTFPIIVPAGCEE